MDADLLEYLEAAVDEVGSLALDHAREAMEEALSRIERAKVLGC